MIDRLLILLFTLIFFSSCSLLNSGTVHIKYTKFQSQVDDVTYENKNELGDVSVSVRNIQHPKQHGKWDINMSLRPSIHFERHTLGTLSHYIDDDGESVQYPDIKMSRLASFANLKLTFHTPIGAFAATYGFGGALSRFEKPDEDESHKTTEIRKVDFVYYGYLSKRFFFLMGPRYYKEQYEQVTFAFRIGYFWGKI